jgi:hypothetical protein
MRERLKDFAKNRTVSEAVTAPPDPPMRSGIPAKARPRACACEPTPVRLCLCEPADANLRVVATQKRLFRLYHSGFTRYGKREVTKPTVRLSKCLSALQVGVSTNAKPFRDDRAIIADLNCDPLIAVCVI